MAAFQFPANPTPGQVYEQYTYNGSEWVLTSSTITFVEEAPADNVPYVRYNLAWISWADARDITAQLADIVDGGDADSGLSTTSTNTIFDGGDADLVSSVAIDSTILEGGVAEPESDNIIDGGLATL